MNIFYNPGISAVGTSSVCTSSLACQAVSRFGMCYADACTQSWRCPVLSKCDPALRLRDSCASPYECSQGYYCLIAESRCESCLLCTDSTWRDCGPVCTSAIDNRSTTELQLSYIMAEASATSRLLSTGYLSARDVFEWIPNRAQANSFIENMDNDLSVAHIVNEVRTRDVTELLCPNGTNDTTTLPWCPCSSSSSSRMACPAGHWCSAAAYGDMQLPTDEVMRAALREAGAVCVPCEAGFECPQGTFSRPQKCTSGSYCEAGGLPTVCPPGSFCVTGSPRPYICDVRELSVQSPTVPVNDPTILAFLGSGATPILGNYCPSGSDALTRGCPGGYYCPNASTRVDCPRGHYCAAWSIAPTRCSPLMSCPANTDRPSYDPVAFVIFGVVLGMLLLVYGAVVVFDRWIIKRRQRGVAQRGLATDLQGFTRLSPCATIHFSNISARVKKRVILNGISGSFVPSGLNVILGPSGSGKTTFLHVMRAFRPRAMRYEGDVKINSQPVKRYAKAVGFVPQDDILHTDLTVYENIYYSGLLAFEDKKRVRLMVTECLHMLHLEGVQDNFIHAISGGQRQRVNIGFEVIRQPPVVFLDEPTSGLDAAVSHDIVCMMRHVGQKLGICMIAVIHQPRYKSFREFDRVMLLSSSGGLVYLGETDEAVRSYFTTRLDCSIPENDNPADAIIDFIGETDDAEMEACWKQLQQQEQEQQEQQEQEHIELPEKVPRWWTFIVLLRRAGIKQLRRWYPVHMVNVALLVTSGLIMGLVHGSDWRVQSFPSNAAIVMTVLSILSMIAHLRTFVSGRLIWNREASNGASVLAFFLANNVIDLIGVCVSPAILLSTYYYLTLPRSPFTAWYVSGLCLTFCVSGIAYLVSVAVPESAVQMTGVFIALITGAFLNGLTPSVASSKGTPMEVILALSYSRWAVESLSVAELWEYRESRTNQVLVIYKAYGYCGVPDTLDQATLYDLAISMDETRCDPYVVAAYSIMVGIGIGSRLFAFMILKWLNKKY